MTKNLFLVTVGILLFVVAMFFVTTGESVLREQVYQGEIEWVEIPVPPESGFDRCWATIVGLRSVSSRDQSIGIVCR
jgi:hypothetical protein